MQRKLDDPYRNRAAYESIAQKMNEMATAEPDYSASAKLNTRTCYTEKPRTAAAANLPELTEQVFLFMTS